MKEFVCINCPRGCLLKVDDNGNITGNFCPRGLIYAKNEMTHPMRNLASIMRISNRKDIMVSVKTSGVIPKEKMFEIMEKINSTCVTAPIEIGDILIKNVCDCGVDIIATKRIN